MKCQQVVIWTGVVPRKVQPLCFLPVNTLLTGRLQRDTTRDSTPRGWRAGEERRGGGGPGSELVSGKSKVATNE